MLKEAYGFVNEGLFLQINEVDIIRRKMNKNNDF